MKFILGDDYKAPEGLQGGAKEGYPNNGPTKVVAAVATGSVAGDAPPQPLLCRLAGLLKDWRETRDNMKARKEDEAAMAVECCMEMLHSEVGDFIAESRAWQTKRAAKPQNGKDEPRPGDGTHNLK